MTMSMVVMSATREGGLGRSLVLLVVALGALGFPSAACKPRTITNVPTLVREASPSPPTNAPPSGPHERPAEPVICLDTKKIVEAHACPPGPDEDYGSIMLLETARLAAKPGKRTKKGTSPRADLSPRLFTASETIYRERVERFVCKAADGIERNEARYALARLHFEAHHWDEAATLFHENAQIPGDATAPYAASLSLESLSSLGATGKTDCYDLLGDRTQAYFESFCGPRRPMENDELCTTLGHILSDVQRYKAESLIRCANAANDTSGAR